MHRPHIQKYHILSHTLHVLEHHIFATLVSVGVALSLLYVLNTPAVRVSGLSANASGQGRALTLLDDSRYEHEFERRAAYIIHHLDILRKDTQAMRAYLVSYRYASTHAGVMPGLEFSRFFESGQREPAERIRDYQDLSRANWMRVERDGCGGGGILPGPFPGNYGIEIYNEQGGAIAYVGIDLLPEGPSYHGKEVGFLRQAAVQMRTYLVGVFE